MFPNWRIVLVAAALAVCSAVSVPLQEKVTDYREKRSPVYDQKWDGIKGELVNEYETFTIILHRIEEAITDEKLQGFGNSVYDLHGEVAEDLGTILLKIFQIPNTQLPYQSSIFDQCMLEDFNLFHLSDDGLLMLSEEGKDCVLAGMKAGMQHVAMDKLSGENVTKEVVIQTIVRMRSVIDGLTLLLPPPDEYYEEPDQGRCLNEYYYYDGICISENDETDVGDRTARAVRARAARPMRRRHITSSSANGGNRFSESLRGVQSLLRTLLSSRSRIPQRASSDPRSDVLLQLEHVGRRP